MITEVEICAAMVSFLQKEGWKTIEEVPLPRSARRADIVAIRDGVMFGIEGKRTLSRELQCQVQNLGRFCDSVALVVSTSPSAKKMDWAEAWGVGVYRISGGSIVPLLQPNKDSRLQFGVVPACREALWNWCNAPQRPVGERAGARLQAGCGLAQQLLPRIAAFLAANPGASWREIFSGVPNHYVHASSMRGALQERLPPYLAKG